MRVFDNKSLSIMIAAQCFIQTHSVQDQIRCNEFGHMQNRKYINKMCINLKIFIFCYYMVGHILLNDLWSLQPYISSFIYDRHHWFMLTLSTKIKVCFIVLKSTNYALKTAYYAFEQCSKSSLLCSKLCLQKQIMFESWLFY